MFNCIKQHEQHEQHEQQQQQQQQQQKRWPHLKGGARLRPIDGGAFGGWEPKLTTGQGPKKWKHPAAPCLPDRQL